jgi:hypothetical protein
VIEGVEVEGFRTTDPNFLAGMGGQVDVKIWVDVKTQLPVRSDMDMHGRCRYRVSTVSSGIPVDDDTFNPVIPADYKSCLGPMKMPS